jgi:hypothetical protein
MRLKADVGASGFAGMTVDQIRARRNIERANYRDRCISQIRIGVYYVIVITLVASTVTIESWDQLPLAVPSACHA